VTRDEMRAAAEWTLALMRSQSGAAKKVTKKTTR
jgi:hypothetical protein